MNYHTIYFSSSSTSITNTLSTVISNDHTEITLDLQNVFSKTIPIFLTIDWGDGTISNIDNDLFGSPERTNVNIFNPNPILSTPYKHEYYPSETSLYAVYTIQLLVYYSNSNTSLFTVPVNIRTNDYYESIGDMSLINVSILPYSYNPKQYQFKTTIDDHIIEVLDDY